MVFCSSQRCSLHSPDKFTYPSPSPPRLRAAPATCAVVVCLTLCISECRCGKSGHYRFRTGRHAATISV